MFLVESIPGRGKKQAALGVVVDTTCQEFMLNATTLIEMAQSLNKTILAPLRVEARGSQKTQRVWGGWRRHEPNHGPRGRRGTLGMERRLELLSGGVEFQVVRSLLAFEGSTVQVRGH